MHPFNFQYKVRSENTGIWGTEKKSYFVLHNSELCQKSVTSVVLLSNGCHWHFCCSCYKHLAPKPAKKKGSGPLQIKPEAVMVVTGQIIVFQHTSEVHTSESHALLWAFSSLTSSKSVKQDKMAWLGIQARAITVNNLKTTNKMSCMHWQHRLILGISVFQSYNTALTLKLLVLWKYIETLSTNSWWPHSVVPPPLIGSAASLQLTKQQF